MSLQSQGEFTDLKLVEETGEFEQALANLRDRLIFSAISSQDLARSGIAFGYRPGRGDIVARSEAEMFSKIKEAKTTIIRVDASDLYLFLGGEPSDASNYVRVVGIERPAMFNVSGNEVTFQHYSGLDFFRPEFLDCQNCSNYEGSTYNGNTFVCAMHPYGWNDDRCPDFEARQK